MRVVNFSNLPSIFLAGSIPSSSSESDVNSSFLRARSFGTFKHEFRMEDACGFIKDGLGVSLFFLQIIVSLQYLVWWFRSLFHTAVLHGFGSAEKLFEADWFT